jgi:enoyl-CoA hydratase/carnithine racemase
MGLLNQLVPSGQLMDTALAMARQIAANKPEAVQAIKRLVGEHIGRGWKEMLSAERGFRGNLEPLPPSESFKDFLATKRRTRAG